MTLLSGLLGAAGFFLGMPNPVAQLPVLVLFYPAMLARLGQNAANAPQAMRRGWLCGFAGASACLYWIVVPVHDVAGQGFIPAGACALSLGAYVGLYGGLFSLFSFGMRERPLWRRALSAGLAWFLLETLRNSLFTGFPWLCLGSAFALWPVWIQLASLVGVYGLGGLFAALSRLLVDGLLEGRARAALAALIGLFALQAFGVVRIQLMEPELRPDLPVALIQGNIDQGQKWDQRFVESTLRAYVDLSSQTAKELRPELLIWPETAMPFDYARSPFAGRIREHAAEAGAWLLFGAPGLQERTEARAARLYNRVYLVDPDGRDQGMYEKEHLVPFGEYVPSWLDGEYTRPLLQGIGNFVPGARTAPLSMRRVSSLKGVNDSLALGILICYETIFPELSRQRVADGAQVLVNVSNDAWFGLTAAPEQHLQLSLLRAVEQGRYLVRGANTGISAVIDPLGRVVARGSLFVAGAVSGLVQPRNARTLFFSVFPWLAPAGLALLAMLVSARPGHAAPRPSRHKAHNRTY
jgi:apolipoprotein N-acyltransferase